MRAFRHPRKTPDGASKALATIGSGPMGPLLDLSGRTFRWYAERHGYDCIIGSGDARGRPAAWAKVPLLRRLLDSYETVVWIDADAVILDGALDIAEQLQPDEYQALVLDRSGKFATPNTGVWVLRGEQAKRFLDAVWAETRFIDHPWWENAAAMHLLGYQVRKPGSALIETKWTTGTRWLDDEWNAIALTRATPTRIRHYAGQRNTYRLRRMQIDLATTDETLKGPLKVLVGTARLIASGERRLG